MTDFEAMGKISRENGPIGLSNLATNLIELRRNKHGYELTIGVDHEWGDKVMANKVVGALYLIDTEAFMKAKATPSEEEKQDKGGK
jgi:hypothetical protein